MAADGLVALVVDGAGLEQALDGPEEGLHRPELLVLEGYFGGGQIRVGEQDPLAVVALLLFHLLRIDGEAVPLRLEVLAVALVGVTPPNGNLCTLRIPFLKRPPRMPQVWRKRGGLVLLPRTRATLGSGRSWKPAVQGWDGHAHRVRHVLRRRALVQEFLLAPENTSTLKGTGSTSWRPRTPRRQSRCYPDHSPAFAYAPDPCRTPERRDRDSPRETPLKSPG